jgi:hypothetical protein
LLVKGDDPVRGRRMPVPVVPAAPIARVALLGGFGRLGPEMDPIPPIDVAIGSRGLPVLGVEDDHLSARDGGRESIPIRGEVADPQAPG